MPVAIKVENVSKLYHLGEIGTGTISQDLQRFWRMKVRRQEDPFLKIGETNDRTTKTEGDIVYSLRDINFKIEQGDAVGIIGRNGAGKSTLLKLLSRVTSPSSGSIKANGRIASLLEVGTGFHPELTGRENIYINGAILGMRKNEIFRKLDEIIAFSGVEKYIDTPVKRYSSGMYVRLAFAVAAHLESEILIVDEVLAVGDAEFQAKCLGKMGEVSKGEGRTVLFVSHNMSAIKALCPKSIYLDKGLIKYDGTTDKAIALYFNLGQASKLNGEIPEDFERHNTGEGRITIFALLNSKGERSNQLLYKEPIKIQLNVKIIKRISEAIFDIKFVSQDGTVFNNSCSTDMNQGFYLLDIGNYKYDIVVNNILQPGIYTINVGLHHKFGNTIDYLEQICEFEIIKIGITEDYKFDWIHGFVNLPSTWTLLEN